MLHALRGLLARVLHSGPVYSLLNSPQSATSTGCYPSPVSSSSSSSSPRWRDGLAGEISALPLAAHFGRALPAVRTTTVYLVPSFLQRHVTGEAPRERRIHATSYLDGLRGLASLLVFFCHFSEGFVSIFVDNPYGFWKDDDPAQASSPLQLPYIRLLYAGRPMVHLFFYISGFVLSAKPLRLIHQRDPAAMASTLSSSIFRRAMRLFAPCAVSSFGSMLLVHYGYGDPNWRFETMAAQLRDWVWSFVYNITVPWNWDNQTWPRYDVHLWTIPIEFAMSMLLFVTIMGTARCPPRLRMALVVLIMLYCTRMGHWAAFEFLGGMFLGELVLLQGRRATVVLPPPNKEMEGEELDMATPNSRLLAYMPPTAHAYLPTGFRLRDYLASICWTLALVPILYIFGWPNTVPDGCFLFPTLIAWTPEPYASTGYNQVQMFWFSVTAFVFMLALLHLPRMRAFFVLPLIQYLGDISYALYLVHGPVMDAIRGPIQATVWDICGMNTVMGRTVAYVLAVSTISVPVICVADVFWRSIDVGSVRLARWMEEKCIEKDA